MEINSIRNAITNYETARNKSLPGTESSIKKDSAATPPQNAYDGVVYESSLDYLSPENASIVTKMKDDLAQRKSQLQSIVQQMMQNQGLTLAKADDVWSFLASGNFTIDEAAKKKAQDEISENGYWGVNQTSDRIVEFAKAISGNDASKADQLLDAFKEGFKQATKTWGKDLPDISQKTYQAVLDKFDSWKKESDTTPTPQDTQTT